MVLDLFFQAQPSHNVASHTSKLPTVYVAAVATGQSVPQHRNPSEPCLSTPSPIDGRARLTPTVNAALSMRRMTGGLLRVSSRCNRTLFCGSPVTTCDHKNIKIGNGIHVHVYTQDGKAHAINTRETRCYMPDFRGGVCVLICCLP